MKLWAVSDLHLGQKQNREALDGLPSFDRDRVIVAGDVGETEELCARVWLLWSGADLRSAPSRSRSRSRSRIGPREQEREESPLQESRSFVRRHESSMTL